MIRIFLDTRRTVDGTTAMPWPASARAISEWTSLLYVTPRGQM